MDSKTQVYKVKTQGRVEHLAVVLWGSWAIPSPKMQSKCWKFNKYNQQCLEINQRHTTISEKCPCFRNHWTSHGKSRNLWSSDPKAFFHQPHPSLLVLPKVKSPWWPGASLPKWRRLTQFGKVGQYTILSKAVRRNCNLGWVSGEDLSSPAWGVYLWAGTPAYSWLRLWYYCCGCWRWHKPLHTSG